MLTFIRRLVKLNGCCEKWKHNVLQAPWRTVVLINYYWWALIMSLLGPVQFKASYQTGLNIFKPTQLYLRYLSSCFSIRMCCQVVVHVCTLKFNKVAILGHLTPFSLALDQILSNSNSHTAVPQRYINKHCVTVITDQCSLSLEEQRTTPGQMFSFVLQWTGSREKAKFKHLRQGSPKKIYNSSSVRCIEKIHTALLCHQTAPSL